MKFRRDDLKLYAVTDRSWLHGRKLYDQVKEALEGGATFYSFAKKNWMRNSFWRKRLKYRNYAENIMCRLS